MRTEKRYAGVVVPMMTPFESNLQVDIKALHTLITHVVENNCRPFVLGTTGEAVSIPRSERKIVVKETVRAVDGNALVYAGISGNSLQETIEEGNVYAALGADVLVSTMPSYYPVDDAQMIRYFEQLADGLKRPLIIYNIPATTHLSIPVAVVEKLSTHPNIVGFKDSEKSEERIKSITDIFKDNENFSYLMGWALKSQTALEQGADGIIPSSGNLAPLVYRLLYDAILAGDNETAAEAQLKGEAVSAYYQQNRILSHSLAAFKAMLAAYGLCESYVLPPLYRLENEAAYQQEALNLFGDIGTINSI
jgi:dihydrodipicolinate synthase/N-acetylneuraminate lyase